MGKTRKILHIFMVLAIAFVINITGKITTNNVLAYSVTDGNVTINIPDYDESVGWIPGQVKTATITVDFEDATSSNKTIKVHLPDGLRYISYPVANAPTSGGLSGIETNATGTFKSLLDSNTSSSVLSFSPLSYTGDVTYNMKDSTEKAEIVMSLTVDEYLYYGPKIFTADNGIKVLAQKNGADIDEAKMGIEAINNGVFDFRTVNSTSLNEYTVLKGDTDPLKISYVYGIRDGFLRPKAFYAKSSKTYLYYPKGVGVSATSIKSTSVGGNYTTEDHPDEGYAFINIVGGTNDTTGVQQTMSLDISKLDVGSYRHLDDTNKVMYHVIEYEAYDGTIVSTKDYSNSLASPLIKVVESSSEKLAIESANRLYNNITDDYQTPITFKISNDLLTEKEDQVLEITPGLNMETREVALPEKMASLKYTTNKNSTYTTLDKSQITYKSSPGIATNSLLALNAKQLGLADDEYFTSVVVSLDKVEKGYVSGILGSERSLPYTYENARVLAKLKDGINSETLMLQTYKLDSNGDKINDSISEKEVTLTRTNDIISGFQPGIGNTTVNAGESKKAWITLDTNGYIYDNAVGMVNPTVYLKLPEGVTIPKESIKVTASNETNAINFTVSDPFTVANGDKYVEISVNHVLGGYFDGIDYNKMYIEFEIKTSLLSSGNYNWSEYAFLIDKSGKTKSGSHYGIPGLTNDVNDLDGDGNVSERLIRFTSNNLIITPKKDLLIDTYIRESKTADRSEPYDTSKPDTAVVFTPGTEAIYNVEVYNNRADATGTKSDLTAWIPVPKKDLDFGSNFQESPGNWNMKLGSVQPVIKVYDVDPITGEETDVTASKAGNYKLEYSTDASSASDYVDATYSTAMSADTTMIRLTNTSGIEMQEKAVIEFVYVVDETPDSVKDTDKLGKINDFRPYYYFSAGSAGYADGTRVGANLAIGEISGIVFKDEDKDGLYKETSDSKLGGIEVTLFRLDENNNYQAYIDPETGVQAKATTDSEGKYKFINLPNGKFKIDFSSVVSSGGVFTPRNIGTDYKIDSDVEQYGSLVGTAQEIDPTKDTSKYIFAGLLEYDPPVDLKLSSEKTSVTILGPLDGTGVPFSEIVNAKIEPTFFDTVADKSYDTDGIKVVSSDDTKITATASGKLTDKGTYLETPVVITGNEVGTGKVTVSIKDVYGQVKEVEIDVTVKPNSRPVITASDTTVEAGDSTFDLLSLASINDAEDGTTGLTRSIKSDGGFNVNVPGTYTIVYESNADSDGNKALDKTITVTVEDTTKPELTITSKDDKTTNPTEITLSATDNATGTITYEWVVVDDEDNEISKGTGTSVTIPTVDGNYTVKATATDASGNKSDEVTFDFVVDATAPVPNIEITPNTKYNPTKVELSAIDNNDTNPKLSYVLKKDGVEVEKVTDVVGPLDIISKTTGDGVYTIELSAKDSEGNTSSTITDTFTIDNTKPVASIVIEPTNKYNPTKIELSATDNLDSNPRLYYVLKKDGVEVDKGSGVGSPQDLLSKATEDGIYTIELYATDIAGNTSTTVDDTFIVDKTKPVITSTSETQKGKIGGEKPSDLLALYGIAASDNIDTTINASVVVVSDNIDMNKLGTYTVTFEVTDAAGNKQTKTVNYIVEALVVSGVIFEDNNYNSKKDDDAFLSGVTVNLINRDTNEIIASTTTDEDGAYKFSVPTGNETVTNYAIMCEVPTGYTLANSVDDQADSDSKMDLTTKKTQAITIAGEDYTNIDIGMAKDVSVSLSPLTQIVYVGDTVFSNLTVTDGTMKTQTIDNSNVTLSILDDRINITGDKVGKDTITVVFENGYKRSNETITKVIEVTILPLPTITSNDKVMKVGDAGAHVYTKTPTDGKVTFTSANTAIASIDSNGKITAKGHKSVIIESCVTTNDKAAKQATSQAVVSIGREKNPGVCKKEAIDSIDFKVKKSELKKLTTAELIKRGKAVAWSTDTATLNQDVKVTSAKLVKSKPAEYTRTNVAKADEVMYVVYKANDCATTASRIVIVDDTQNIKKPIKPPKGGTNEVVMSLMLLAVASMSGITYGLTRRKININ